MIWKLSSTRVNIFGMGFRRLLMIQGQISIFELLDQSSTSNKNCQDCYAWHFNRCTWGEMMIPTYPKCVNKDKWHMRDDVRKEAT